MLGSPNITYLTVDEKAKARDTYPGMAHFAGTGPAGKRCEDCRYLTHLNGTNRNSFCCDEYHRLTGKDGPKIPKAALSCKYFEDKNGSKVT